MIGLALDQWRNWNSSWDERMLSLLPFARFDCDLVHLRRIKVNRCSYPSAHTLVFAVGTPLVPANKWPFIQLFHQFSFISHLVHSLRIFLVVLHHLVIVFHLHGSLMDLFIWHEWLLASTRRFTDITVAYASIGRVIHCYTESLRLQFFVAIFRVISFTLCLVNIRRLLWL